MIGFLRGIVLTVKDSSLILDVSGVGYKINTPLPLIVSAKANDELSLYIHTHVKEDQLSLYGFKDENDLFIFEQLISVSGIGPKSGLAMISLHPPASIAEAVENGDAATLSHTPGIGKKTAEKVIIELKGKLSHLVGGTRNVMESEARLALETLGYSSKEIHAALQKIKIGTKSTSAIIKEALTELQ
jgi:holliday junction DNA helicase RuvA